MSACLATEVETWKGDRATVTYSGPLAGALAANGGSHPAGVPRMREVAGQRGADDQVVPLHGAVRALAGSR